MAKGRAGQACQQQQQQPCVYSYVYMYLHMQQVISLAHRSLTQHHSHSFSSSLSFSHCLSLGTFSFALFLLLFCFLRASLAAQTTHTHTHIRPHAQLLAATPPVPFLLCLLQANSSINTSFSSSLAVCVDFMLRRLAPSLSPTLSLPLCVCVYFFGFLLQFSGRPISLPHSPCFAFCLGIFCLIFK